MIVDVFSEGKLLTSYTIYRASQNEAITSDYYIRQAKINLADDGYSEEQITAQNLGSAGNRRLRARTIFASAMASEPRQGDHAGGDFYPEPKQAHRGKKSEDAKAAESGDLSMQRVREARLVLTHKPEIVEHVHGRIKRAKKKSFIVKSCG
jgi:hypothetical protein